ncbi:hypothetical protein CXG81DRAFT_13801 [Caulochytrium protostelioides]|uniref:4-hydroxyphenylpyruvate dioxygenase n=1 Tax=Caulochytrium protostelioides TaxID=1555241 RepID=A0A4P9X4K8_9FUNG|nr:4-hydroxyphenylpyruvate dioxygenase [Caulochytrium protostelioides]RKO99981.1 hypothetical protein CXG81DRAFT_13801 [Caulochytrium protostelioides]|eukprot:RKO99981.1 hypothetical protein CXG81DRAFT_13801 [Caulochytrium protostelioides]
MTSYQNTGPKPEVGQFTGYDHIVFWVGNAKQAANYYCTRLGFQPVGYRGLETGDRDVASWVVRINNVVFVLRSSLSPNDSAMGTFLAMHGDAVRDVAFTVDDCRGLYAKAVARGAESVREPWEETDEHGTVVMATVKTYGDCVHTFVQRSGYTGAFLPGYTPVPADPISQMLPPTHLERVDHVVGNQADDEMVPICDYYEKIFDFHRFWSVDDKQMSTKYSALRSIVMTDYSETVKMPINEPAPGLKKSQVQEYVDFNGKAGVQHIALRTTDIITAVTNLRARGVEFLTIPDTYYEQLKQRLAQSKTKIAENMDTLQRLCIQVDFDENGYLLQIFTKPMQDRPTLFVEIIQRHNHSGFGAGNFKALFEALEAEQARRGNL